MGQGLTLRHEVDMAGHRSHRRHRTSEEDHRNRHGDLHDRREDHRARQDRREHRPGRLWPYRADWCAWVQPCIC